MANKKSPLMITAGVALAAIAAVLGLTQEKWRGAGTPATPAALSQPGGGASTAAETAIAAAPATTEVVQQPAATADAPAAAPGPAEPQGAAVAPAVPPAAAPAAPAPAAAAAPAVPSFDTVRVEKTGEAVIAGHAEPQAQVTALLDGKPVGTAVAGSDGSFVVLPDKPLPAGGGALSIQAQAAGAAPVVSEQQVAVLVPETPQQAPVVALTAPAQPTKVLQAPAPAPQAAAAAPAATPGKVTLDAIDYDADGSIRFSGTAAPGSAVRLYVDNAPLADAGADGDGRWTLASNGVAPGNHLFRADALDATGRVTARVELPFTHEAPAALAAAAAVAPAAPEAAPAEAPAAAAPDPVLPKDGRVVIQPGNNLWRIARVIYGDGRRYTEIFDANKGLIKNPDRIYPGQIFATPNVVPPEQIDPKQREPLPSDAATATP